MKRKWLNITHKSVQSTFKKNTIAVTQLAKHLRDRQASVSAGRAESRLGIVGNAVLRAETARRQKRLRGNIKLQIPSMRRKAWMLRSGASEQTKLLKCHLYLNNLCFYLYAYKPFEIDFCCFFTNTCVLVKH